MTDWPKLTESLTGPKAPDRCQSCAASEGLARWQEHDYGDRPTPAVVVLCAGCSGRIIEPHPRLYRRLDTHEPHPGSMPICLDCTRREGTACTHADARANGGPGVMLALPRPGHAIACTRGKGGGCRHLTIWSGPVKGCRQRELP